MNPKDIKAKFAKERQANFIGLPEDILENVLNWHTYLKERGFNSKDPLFPCIDSHFTQGCMLQNKVSRKEIKSGTTIRDIFKKAFMAAGYEYIKPHNFRHTITRMAAKHSPEYLNAVRQSLGHSNIDTTLHSYGELAPMQQRTVITALQVDTA